MNYLKEKTYLIVKILLSCLFLQVIPASQAANQLIFDANKSGCSTLYQTSIIFGNRFQTSSQVTITAINVSIGNGATTNFATSAYYIMSDSSSKPGSVLATFLPSTISGSGATTIAQFTNSGYTINANTFIWIVPAQQSATLAQCYANGIYTADQFAGIGINVDTSTSLNNSNWPRSYTSNSSPINATWTIQGNTPLVWQLSLESAPLTPVTVSLSATNGLNTGLFRTNKSLTATVNTDSKVTFYQNGKKISGCIKISTNAGSAICLWKPSIRGSIVLSADAYPISGSYLTGSSSKFSIFVSSRGNVR